jgi:fatty-acyl-CoA synthase
MPDYGLGSWPARRARINPNGVALRQFGGRAERAVTYRELAADVDRLAGGLAARGVGHGDRVAYLGRNDIGTFELLFATTRLGAIFVPMNTRLSAPEIRYQVDDVSPALLVYGPECAELADGIANAVPLGQALALHGKPVGADVALADDAVILFTSGTTGRPKGAVLTHANITFNTMNQLAHADVLSSDTALCIPPLFHAAGLGQVSLPTLFKGGTVAVVPTFEPGVVLGLVERSRIASFAAVPVMLQILCDHPDFATTDLGSLRYVIYGGSMVLERVAVAWQRRGVDILQGYGMTEASPGVYLAPADGSAARPVSIGVPHFFTDVTFDPSTDAPEPGASGELLVRGLNVFRGYWQRPDDTANAFTDGWYHTGDVVTVDDDGWAYVIDRVRDLIISGGENVSPSEVEAAIAALPGIVDCAVVGVPDERWGEVGAAYVVASRPWTETSLREALSGTIANFKIPRDVHFVDDLPRTASGKVRKQDLRAQA